MWLTKQIRIYKELIYIYNLYRYVDRLLKFSFVLYHHHKLPRSSKNIGRFISSSSRWMYEKNRHFLKIAVIIHTYIYIYIFRVFINHFTFGKNLCSKSAWRDSYYTWYREIETEPSLWRPLRIRKIKDWCCSEIGECEHY